MIRKEVFVIW